MDARLGCYNGMIAIEGNPSYGPLMYYLQIVISRSGFERAYKRFEKLSCTSYVQGRRSVR